MPVHEFSCDRQAGRPGSHDDDLRLHIKDTVGGAIGFIANPVNPSLT
jgi:hypothetical protein